MDEKVVFASLGSTSIVSSPGTATLAPSTKEPMSVKEPIRRLTSSSTAQYTWSSAESATFRLLMMTARERGEPYLTYTGVVPHVLLPLYNKVVD
jgi:hypothetical protein